MKIGVCIKQVPDTASAIRVKEDRSGIIEDGIKFVVSPYDEYAVEEALRTKGKVAGSEVVAITIGPKRSQEALRNALAMGCDRAIHVNTDGHAPMDSLGVARLLASQIKTEALELVFTGRHAVDDDNAQVSQMTAELLGWPHATMVIKCELDAGAKKARVERPIEGGAKEIWEIELPAVLAATKGLNEPRYASLKGIMQAKSKPLKEIPVAQGGVAETDLAPKVIWSNYTLPPERKAGKVFKDDPAKAVHEVVRLLREEAKVI
ncbi:MAG TPA: electron transfer flavoprotein subunit beta/FixA family protein [Bdellovibrionota bacterium]|nr:electron transfer flavoprotein subunit beta/FixA family protein [Bdellovibrionota bacterium]